MSIDQKTSEPIATKSWTLLKRSEGIPVLNMSIRCPEFASTGKAARVERYFARLCQYWQNRWETILFPAAKDALANTKDDRCAFTPWAASLDYKVTYQKEQTVSLLLITTETGRTPDPLHIHQGETWDLQIGYPRSLRSFFPINAGHWRRDLINQLKEQAVKQLNSGESLLDADCAEILDRTFDPDRFYLTESGINLFYPLYVLGPYAEGIPTFQIPFPMEH